MSRSAGRGSSKTIRKGLPFLILHEFRDHILPPNNVGRAFVELYYAYSPPVAEFIAKHDAVRPVVSWTLLRVVGVSWIALELGPVSSLAFILLFITGLIGLVGFRRKSRKR